MGEVLGLGMSHYPGICMTDKDMSYIFENALKDPNTPADLKDPAGWPDEMQVEWRDSEQAAGQHRAAMVENFDRVRASLDAFQPDVVLI